MNEIEQDKSPLASHCHRPERGLREVVYVSHSANGNMGYGWVKAGMIFPFLDRQVPKPPARRGRPPNKNKKPAVTPTSQDIAPDVIYAPKPTTVPEKPAIFYHFRWINEQRTEGNAELSGSMLKGLPAKWGHLMMSFQYLALLTRRGSYLYRYGTI